MRRWIGERVARGESLIGVFVSSPSLATSEVLAACGFDVLVADAEHSPLSPADVRTIIAGADLAVKHLSMVFVGPNDLSHSLGRPPEEELREVIDDVLVRAHAAGVRTGILAPTPDLVGRYRRAGVSLLVTGSDLALLAAGA